MYYTLNDFNAQYDIATEGFMDSVKRGLKKVFLAIVRGLKKLVSKCRDSKLKKKIMGLLERAEKALGSCG